MFVGRTNCSLCPVAAALSYITKRGSDPGPLFKFINGRPLTRARFVSEVKEALATSVIQDTAFVAGQQPHGSGTRARRYNN